MHALLAVLLLMLSQVGPATAAAVPSGRTIELRADAVTLRQGGAVVEARGRVRVTDGRNRMAAEHAVYTLRARRIALSGSVTIATPQGNLEADAATAVLAAGNAVETIDAAGRVTLEAQQRVVRAERLVYAVSSGAVTADGGVEAFIPPDLTARGRTLLMKSGEAATLRGSARVQTTDGYVEGDRIDISERTQVAFARGNVVGVFGETRITAAAATFYRRERRAVFRDGVRVTRPGRTIQAESVTLFLQDRRIVAEGETTIRVEDEPPRP